MEEPKKMVKCINRWQCRQTWTQRSRRERKCWLITCWTFTYIWQ